MEYMEQQMQQQIEAGLSNAEQCYARIADLEDQNAALAAQVEALREAWKAVKRNDWDAPLDEAFEKTPQHHLCQVRADAVMSAANYFADNLCVSLVSIGSIREYAAIFLTGKDK